MQAVIQSTFPVHAEAVRTAILKPETLQSIARPIITFQPTSADTFPDTWQEGALTVKVRLFGVIPLGQQVIDVDSGDDQDDVFLRDNGQGAGGVLILMTRWDHRIYIQPQGEGKTTYTDLVEVEAGVFTLPMVAFARFFFTWRQRRLRRLLQSTLKT